MIHPTHHQLEEYNAGLCGLLKSAGIRFHLCHCASCKALLRDIRQEEAAQSHFAAEALRYAQAEVQANRAFGGEVTTMTADAKTYLSR